MRENVVAILFTALAVCSCSQPAAVSNSSPSPATAPTQAVATATPSFTLCNGTFALCTSAQCKRVPGTNDKVNCSCSVQQAYSAGTNPCATVPQGSPKANEAIPSRYSPISSMAVCSIDAPWAFCLDKPCTVNDDLTSANCVCDVKHTREQSYVVVAGTKDNAMCTDAIWSSATVQDVIGITGFLYSQPQQLPPSPITIVRVETAQQ